MKSHRAGFTLIEVLIAVAIFALMAAAAYRGLDAVLASHRRVEVENEKWRNAALLLARLERDLSVTAPRGIRDAVRGLAPALAGEAVAMGDYGAQLAFTRTGGGDDAVQLAAPQRVGYRLRDGKVELLLWPVLDQGPRTVPDVGVLLDGVADLKFRYWDAAGQWRDRWPAISGPDGDKLLPAAVEVTLTLSSGEALVRLIDLPRAQK